MLGHFLDAQPLVARVSRAIWAISLLLRRSNSISDGVNVRGAGEVPSFRLSEAVEGVTEPFPPPLLEGRSVLLFDLMQLLQ